MIAGLGSSPLSGARYVMLADSQGLAGVDGLKIRMRSDGVKGQKQGGNEREGEAGFLNPG